MQINKKLFKKIKINNMFGHYTLNLKKLKNMEDFFNP